MNHTATRGWVGSTTVHIINHVEKNTKGRACCREHMRLPATPLRFGPVAAICLLHSSAVPPPPAVPRRSTLLRACAEEMEQPPPSPPLDEIDIFDYENSEELSDES